MTLEHAELVARLRTHEGIGAALSGNTRYICAAMDEAATAIETLERERDEARVQASNHAYRMDKAREERDVAERRSEAFWKPQITAAATEVAQLKRELNEDRRALSEVSKAIGSVRWMDPPDGGNVTLAEQVRRMRDDLVSAEAKVAMLEEALRAVDTWAKAYPTDVFIEPDFAEVQRLLGPVLLSQVSASNMRHVLTGIAGLVSEALKATP